jgi:hypothetical protein
MDFVRADIADDRVSIAFRDLRFSGHVTERDGGWIYFSHDLAPYHEPPLRGLLLARVGSGWVLAHANRIPILEWCEGAPERTCYHEVRMLRQVDFDQIHPRNRGQRGAYSPFTGICDIALDNRFFRDEQGGLILENIRSTLAHELAHRAFAQMSLQEREELLAPFMEDHEFWRQVRASFYGFWGVSLSLPYDERGTYDELVVIVDELLAKVVSYRYRPSRAKAFTDYLLREVFAARATFRRLDEEVRRLTEEHCTTRLTVPFDERLPAEEPCADEELAAGMSEGACAG